MKIDPNDLGKMRLDRIRRRAIYEPAPGRDYEPPPPFLYRMLYAAAIIIAIIAGIGGIWERFAP